MDGSDDVDSSMSINHLDAQFRCQLDDARLPLPPMETANPRSES